MLTLSRYAGERIRVTTRDGDVWFTVVAVEGQRVRVGVEAPKACGIAREELLGHAATTAEREPGTTPGGAPGTRPA